MSFWLQSLIKVVGALHSFFYDGRNDVLSSGSCSAEHTSPVQNLIQRLYIRLAVKQQSIQFRDRLARQETMDANNKEWAAKEIADVAAKEEQYRQEQRLIAKAESDEIQDLHTRAGKARSLLEKLWSEWLQSQTAEAERLLSEAAETERLLQEQIAALQVRMATRMLREAAEHHRQATENAANAKTIDGFLWLMKAVSEASEELAQQQAVFVNAIARDEELARCRIYAEAMKDSVVAIHQETMEMMKMIVAKASVDAAMALECAIICAHAFPFADTAEAAAARAAAAGTFFETIVAADEVVTALSNARETVRKVAGGNPS